MLLFAVRFAAKSALVLLGLVLVIVAATLYCEVHSVNSGVSLRVLSYEYSAYDSKQIWEVEGRHGIRIFYREYAGVSFGDNLCWSVSALKVRFCYETNRYLASPDQLKRWIEQFGSPPPVEEPPAELRGVSFLSPPPYTAYMQEVQQNVPLAPRTTFDIGGAAKYFVDVRTEEDIREAIAWAKERDLRHVILGGGSNVLVPDGGLDALVIHIVGNLFGVKDCMVDSWAGTNLLELIRACGAQGCGGWEKLAGIPGTIGGAVRGNAGAFGPEIKDFAVKVKALNAETGETREFSNAECDFSYRHSFFKDHPEWIITRAVLQLQKMEPAENARLADETIAEREKRHLQNVKAAGSFFMNPKASPEIVEMFEKEKQVKSRENRVPAGWLIEKVGMKGATVGGAIASLQHPNYIVNQGGATAADVRTLAEKVRETVRVQCDVLLAEEAAIL